MMAAHHIQRRENTRCNTLHATPLILHGHFLSELLASFRNKPRLSATEARAGIAWGKHVKDDVYKRLAFRFALYATPRLLLLNNIRFESPTSAQRFTWRTDAMKSLAKHADIGDAGRKRRAFLRGWEIWGGCASRLPPPRFRLVSHLRIPARGFLWVSLARASCAIGGVTLRLHDLIRAFLTAAIIPSHGHWPRDMPKWMIPRRSAAINLLTIHEFYQEMIALYSTD